MRAERMNISPQKIRPTTTIIIAFLLMVEDVPTLLFFRPYILGLTSRKRFFMGNPFPFRQFEKDIFKIAVNPGSRSEFIRRSSGNNPAGLNYSNLLTYLLRHVKGMCGHEDGLSFKRHIPEYVFYQSRSHWIKAYHRLIHYKNLRIMQQGSAHPQPLLHPVRIALHQLILPMAQIKYIQELYNAIVKGG